MLSFNFNGKDSYIDFGIIIAKRPSIPSPKRRISYIDIPSRDSSLRYDEGTYEDITIILESSIKDVTNVADKIDNIKARLSGAGESDLIFSFQASKKYIAQVVNSIDFKQVYKFISTFPIVFNCRPFKYSTDNEVITITQSPSIINNEGTFKNEPVIKVYGSGDITININDESILIKDVDEYVTIDSVLKDCYKDYVLKNSDMIGDFPILNTGENVVSFSSSVSKMDINVNTVWL